MYENAGIFFLTWVVLLVDQLVLLLKIKLNLEGQLNHLTFPHAHFFVCSVSFFLSLLYFCIAPLVLRPKFFFCEQMSFFHRFIVPSKVFLCSTKATIVFVCIQQRLLVILYNRWVVTQRLCFALLFYRERWRIFSQTNSLFIFVSPVPPSCFIYLATSQSLYFSRSETNLTATFCYWCQSGTVPPQKTFSSIMASIIVFLTRDQDRKAGQTELYWRFSYFATLLSFPKIGANAFCLTFVKACFFLCST